VNLTEKIGVRKIDELSRIILPNEVKKKLGWGEKDSLALGCATNLWGRVEIDKADQLMHPNKQNCLKRMGIVGIKQELTGRREELIIKITQLWDELIEVDEYITVTEGGEPSKKPQSKQQNAMVNLREMELNLRDAALRRASGLLSETLSNLDEVRPECPNCGDLMKKKKNEPNK